MKIVDLILHDMTVEQRKGVTTVVWRSLLIFYLLWGTGMLVPIGLTGFAWAGDLREVDEKVSEIQSELLEQRIFETRVSQCTADSRETRQFYTRKLSELLSRYALSHKRSYRLPECVEIQ